MRLTRQQWYWTLQLTGWSLYALLGVGIYAMIGEFSAKMLPIVILSAAMMLGSTHLLRKLIRQDLIRWREKTWRWVLKVILFLLASSLVINLIDSLFLVEVAGAFSWEEFSVPFLLLYMLQTNIYFVLWLGAYGLIRNLRSYRQQEIEKWKLESAVKEAELIALKAQVNPHFLFNALNNIRALISEDPEKSRDMITHLADLLRYSIPYTSKERVPLQEELDMVSHYLELESIHYEDRLQYRMEVEPGLSQVSVPPMVIQLMVENAIKHGISLLPGGGTIEISVTQGGAGDTAIRVSNTGSLQPKTGREGIGLRNALDRVRLITGSEPRFSLEQAGDRVVSQLIIPNT